LEPSDRSWLHTRIAQRFDTMLEQGFVDEVRALRARGDLHADLPSMRCVGYRQVWEALDAQALAGPGAALDLAEVRERGIIATRQLAKRQITWLRSMPQRQVVRADGADALQDVLALVRRALG
jgi:tRNA dimethylallyltransferase